jgi:protein-S-isoprenylcysteine O-methyltransferase Ste14
MSDRPGVIAPPPVLFFAFFAVGWFARGLLPPFRADKSAIAIAVPAALLMAWGIATMICARTNIDPSRPATTVVTSGPFRFTRNPLYLSMNLLYLAAALKTGALTALALLPVANALLHFGVIRREERYLEAKFGDAYRAYRSRVRRWL